MTLSKSDQKSPQAFRTIGEVAEYLNLEPHVLRFWESQLPNIIKPYKHNGRRYYRPGDIELLKQVKHLLHQEGYTIRGVKKFLGSMVNTNIHNQADLFSEESPPTEEQPKCSVTQTEESGNEEESSDTSLLPFEEKLVELHHQLTYARDKLARVLYVA